MDILRTGMRELYDNHWHKNLENGKEDFGDLNQALEFLKTTDILRPYHKILEIGGGIGKLSYELKQNGYKHIVCTDISAVSVEYGRRKYPELEILRMDANVLDFRSEEFDVCLSFDLVEHLADVDQHLAEVHRVLKENGYYLFQTPNIMTNSIWETYQSGGFSWRKYHPSLQSSSSLTTRLTRAGFSNVSFLKLPPTSEHKLNLLPSILKIGFQLIPWHRLPMFMQIGFWTIAQK